VFDPAAFARGLERAFEAMARSFAAGSPRDGFDIDPV